MSRFGADGFNGGWGKGIVGASFGVGGGGAVVIETIGGNWGGEELVVAATNWVVGLEELTILGGGSCTEEYMGIVGGDSGDGAGAATIKGSCCF